MSRSSTISEACPWSELTFTCEAQVVNTSEVSLQLQRTRARSADPSQLQPILVLGGISSTRKVFAEDGSGWWQELAQVMDWHHTEVITLDLPLGLGESEWRGTQPVSFNDYVKALIEALQVVAPQGFKAFIGGSFGGTLALALAQHQPSPARVVCIAAAHRPHAYAIALRRFQRAFVTHSSDPANGVVLARALAMLNYRDPEAFDQYQLQGYDYCLQRAQALYERHPERLAQLFLQLGEILDGAVVAEFAPYHRYWLLGFNSDQLVPPPLMQACAAAANAPLTLLPSSYGHDGFIKEVAAFGPDLTRFLATEIS